MGLEPPPPFRLPASPPDSSPLTPLLGARDSARERLFPDRVTPFPSAHVNAAELPGIEVPSTARDHHTRPREPVWGALPPLAGGGSRRTCSSTFRKTSTRPSTLAVRLRLPGRVRSHDFCKRSLLRARPWTTRTSRAAGIGRRDDWHVHRRLPLDRPIAGAPRGQGSRESDSRHSPPGLLTVETSPQPRSLRAPPVAGKRPDPLSGVTWGRALPPPRRLLARPARERVVRRLLSAKKSGRSPTRGAFRREAALWGLGRSWPPAEADCPPRLRLFHLPGGPARGTLARAPEARSFVQGERRTTLSTSDRSALHDFCVRVEVHSQKIGRAHV